MQSSDDDDELITKSELDNGKIPCDPLYLKEIAFRKNNGKLLS